MKKEISENTKEKFRKMDEERRKRMANLSGEEYAKILKERDKELARIDKERPWANLDGGAEDMTLAEIDALSAHRKKRATNKKTGGKRK